MHQPNVLFKQVKPVGGDYDGGRTLDIRVKDGKIVKIGEDLNPEPSSEQVVEGDGSYLSPGWMDMHVHLREPGFEQKETIESGCKAAAFGGFTELACMPNTNPAIHTRDMVEFVIQRALPYSVKVHPIGAVSKDRAGKNLVEMADMKEGGAVAFSDDGDPVYNPQMMRLALEYASMLDMPIINHEEVLSLSRPGHMNEGRVSTRLGLEGSPGIAEEVMICRDIMLAEFCDAHVHIAHLSTRKGMELVRQAKDRGLKVTTEVCPHHFDLTENEIERRSFDSNCKMHPPLRTEDDRQAMLEGLADGTIDAICTDHAPHSPEDKEVEFIYAPNGIIGLETAWPVAVKRLLEENYLSIQQLVSKLVDAPRNILNLDVPRIEEGAEANLTLFNTDEEWEYTEDQVRSQSLNSPYLDKKLKGRAQVTYNKQYLTINKLL